VEKCGRTRQATNNDMIRRLCIACWLTADTVTPSENVIIVAFPRASVLRCTYITCLKFTSFLILCCLDRTLFDLSPVLTSETFSECFFFFISP
jgi:hypothetical protein